MNDNEQLDNILDEALSAYREAEPLAGLEDRVLQRLRLQPESRRIASWKWGALAACAVLLSIVAWLGWHGHGTQTKARPQPIEVRNNVAPPETKTATGSADTGSSNAAPQRLSKSQAKSGQDANEQRLGAESRRAQALIQNDREREYSREPVPLTREERQLLAVAQTHPDALQTIAHEDQPISIAPLTIQPLPSEANQNGDN
jgi:hypothetical protein